VVSHPRDGSLLFAGSFDVLLDRGQCIGVVRHGTLSFGREFILGIDDNQGLHHFDHSLRLRLS
jgi:hypothetical protein